MFHLELFSSSNATSGANTYIQANYVTADAILQSLNSGMQVPAQLPKLMAVMGVGAHMVHIRVNALSLKPMPYMYLSPNNRGTAFESPPRIWDFSSNPIAFRPLEELDMFTSQNSGGTETPYVAILMTDGVKVPYPAVRQGPSPDGNGTFVTVHGTASTTLTAGAFSQVTFSLDEALPAGFYALCGARVFSATARFFRMFPSQGQLWRPGGVAVQAYDSIDPYNQRFMPEYGPGGFGWGVWLYFYNTNVPAVEIFATSADTAEEAWFDLIKVSDATVQGTF